jgi:hypothetical protein
LPAATGFWRSSRAANASSRVHSSRVSRSRRPFTMSW